MRATPLLALLLLGCPGGPDQSLPPEIDLTTARRHEEYGRTYEALAEYAARVEDLIESKRTDIRAQVGWGRILSSLKRLKFDESMLAKAPPVLRTNLARLKPWSTPTFLSAGAAGRWSQVLALGAEPPILAEAAGHIADLLAEKLDDRSLRRGRLEPEGDVSEKLYRRSLAHAASDYAQYAVCRLDPPQPEVTARAVKLLRRFGQECRELAALPKVRTGPAERWAQQATDADAAALAIRRDRDKNVEPPSNPLRLLVESDAAGLLKTAVEDVNKANDMLSRRADENEILETQERALRNFVAARECLLEPSPIQKRTLDVMPMAADDLRSLAFTQ